MATPENRNAPQRQEQQQEQSERLINTFGLSTQLNRLWRALGTVQPPIENVNERQLDTMREQMQQRSVYTSYADLARENEIFWRIKAIQREAALVQERLTPAEQERNRRELVVANQAITYNQYVPAVIEQVCSFMDLYQQEFLELLPFLPEEQRELLRGQYRQAVEYLHVLKEAVNQRHTYASVLQIDRQIAEVEDRLRRGQVPAEERQQLEQRKADLARSLASTFALLSPENQTAVRRGRELFAQSLTEQNPQRLEELRTQYDRLHAERHQRMDADIIDILKGNPEGRENLGVPRDFLPQRLYLQAMQLRYGQLRDVQQQIARRDDWSEQQKADAQRELSRMRREYMGNMIVVTQQLAGHQQAMAELTTIQNQFGNNFNLTDARRDEGRTPDEVLREVDRSIDGARDFHVGRLSAMLTQVDRSFNPGGFEALRDEGIMRLLENVDGFSGSLRKLITGALPDGPVKQRIDQWLDSSLPLALRESLDSGVGPDGRALTKQQKLERIRDVIIRFRDTHAVARFQTTVSLIQGMPAASTYVGQRVANPLPASPEGGIRTAEQREDLVRRHGGATVYAMLVDQMRVDGQAFHTAYKRFLTDMENLVDVRLSLIAEVDTIAQSWRALAITLTGAAGAALVLPWVAGGSAATIATSVVWRGGRALIRAPGGILRGVRALGPEAVGRTAGASALAYRTYLDFQELGELSNSIENQRTRMIADLRAAGFQPDPPDQEDTFRYKDGGTEVRVNIREINQAQRGQETAQSIRTLVSAAEVLAVLRFGVSRTFLPLMAVEAVVETVRYGVDQAADRRFVLRAPPWLLAKINLQEATGNTAYEILVKASGEMMTDSPFSDAQDSRENREKREMREKMLFAILNRELREFPGLQLELYGGSNHPLNLQNFFAESGGYKDVFLPAFYSRLFELSGNGLSWAEVSRGQIDEDWNVPLPDSPEITQVEIRRAMRETIVFFIQHKREEQYMSAVAERDRARQEVAALRNRATPEGRRLMMRLEILEDMVRTLGEAEVFGQALNRADIAVLRRNNGRTRAQLAARYLFEQADNRRFSVPGEQIPGLPEGFSFGARGSIYRFTNDVELQASLRNVFPDSINEPEGRVWDPILQHIFTARNWLPSTDVDQRSRSAHHARIAANNITRDTRLRELDGDASEDAARQRITEAAIALAERDERRGRSFARDQRMEEERFGGRANRPLLYTRTTVRGGAGQQNFRDMESAMRSLARPPSLEGQHFKEENLVAVFIEGEVLPSSGHSVALATYVYGDPTTRDTDNPQFYVVHCARGTFATSNSRGDVLGHNRVLGGRNFLRQTGAREMMALLDAPMEERRQNIIAQRRRDAEREREVGRARATAERAQAAARELARRTPNTWVAYPEMPSRRPDERYYDFVQYYSPGGEGNGRFLYIDLPRVTDFSVPSVSAAGPADGSAPADQTPRMQIANERGEVLWHLSRSAPNYRSFVAEENRDPAAQALFTRILTSPLPRNSLGSIRNILAAYTRDIDLPGNRPLEQSLLQAYNRLTTDDDRRLFLERVEQVCWKYTETGGTMSPGSLASIFEHYGVLFSSRTVTPEQWARFLVGIRTFSAPNANGVFEHNAQQRGATSLFYYFDTNQGVWMWSPPGDTPWYPTSRTSIPWRGKENVEPTPANLAVIRSLR